MRGRACSQTPQQSENETYIMAMSDVTAFLCRGEGRRNFLGKFVLLSDNHTDGSFLVHYFISQALKDGHAVVLVSCAQGLSHYSSIATKLGVNLVKSQTMGQLVFVDCFSQLLSRLWESGRGREGEEGDREGEGRGEQDGTATHLTYSLDSDFSLHGLYKLVRNAITRLVKLKPDRPVYLVVDDLSVLLSLGLDVKTVVDVIHYCHQMLCSHDGLCKGEGCLVAMVHCESDSGEVEAEELLRAHLMHRCDVSLSAEGLKTGYSREVHGEIKMEWRMRGCREPPLWGVEGEGQGIKSAQFKTGDWQTTLLASETVTERMVLAFLCHSVSGTPCRILYSAVYGDDLQLSASEGTVIDSLRTIRKDQLMQVTCRVQAEFGFRTAAKDRVVRSKDDFLGSGSSDEIPSEKGLFRLSPGDPFSTAKVVIWQVTDNCAYVLVCELDENRLQAESILALLVRLVLEHVIAQVQNAEVLLKAEKLSAILHLFLPNGQLLFLNHKVIAQFEKQLEKTLSGK